MVTEKKINLYIKRIGLCILLLVAFNCRSNKTSEQSVSNLSPNALTHEAINNIALTTNKSLLRNPRIVIFSIQNNGSEKMDLKQIHTNLFIKDTKNNKGKIINKGKLKLSIKSSGKKITTAKGIKNESVADITKREILLPGEQVEISLQIIDCKEIANGTIVCELISNNKDKNISKEIKVTFTHEKSLETYIDSKKVIIEPENNLIIIPVLIKNNSRKTVELTKLNHTLKLETIDPITKATTVLFERINFELTESLNKKTSANITIKVPFNTHDSQELTKNLINSNQIDIILITAKNNKEIAKTSAVLQVGPIMNESTLVIKVSDKIQLIQDSQGNYFPQFMLEVTNTSNHIIDMQNIIYMYISSLVADQSAWVLANSIPNPHIFIQSGNKIEVPVFLSVFFQNSNLQSIQQLLMAPSRIKFSALLTSPTNQLPYSLGISQDTNVKYY